MLILALILAYLLGSLSFAILVSRLRGLADPRTYGSKNPGATNMLRSGDKLAAGLTLLGDAIKGLLAMLIMRAVLEAQPSLLTTATEAQWLSAAAIGVFLGHLFPIYFGFKGGKGVATALGVLLGFDVLLGLAALAAWLLMLLVLKISAVSALTAAITAPIAAALGLRPDAAVVADQSPVVWAVLAMSLLLIWRHLPNIRQLLQKD